MKKSSTIFLQIVIILIGLGVLTFMLIEPSLEGRNAHSTFFETYFTDSFIAYIYISSIAFFVGLYNGFKVLGLVRNNKIFSETAVISLRRIKYCAFITAAAIIGAGLFLFIFAKGDDDGAGAAMLGMITTLLSIIVGTAMGMFEKVLKSAVDMKVR